MENYTESYYSGDIFASDNLFPMYAVRKADCDFSFNDVPYSKEINSGDKLFLSNDLINFERR